MLFEDKLTADQRVHLESLSLAVESFGERRVVNSDVVLERAKEFENYIRTGKVPSSELTEQTKADIIRVARHVRSHDDRPYEESDRLLAMLGETVQ